MCAITAEIHEHDSIIYSMKIFYIFGFKFSLPDDRNIQNTDASFCILYFSLNWCIIFAGSKSVPLHENTGHSKLL